MREMIGSSVKHPPALILVIVLALAAALLTGGGASSLQDTETATDAKAAENAAISAAAAVTTEAPAVTADAATTAPSADNAGAWDTIKTGAETFAAQLDQGNQSVASCETNAAAGADFDRCVGKSYRLIAAAAVALVHTVDQTVGQTDGQCRDALATFRSATQSMADDYTHAITTTDLTSKQTLEARLGDDTQTYADTTFAAAAACVS